MFASISGAGASHGDHRPYSSEARSRACSFSSFSVAQAQAEAGDGCQIATPVADLQHNELVFGNRRDGGVVQRPQPDLFPLEDMAAFAQEDQFVVGGLHLGGRGPIEDDVADPMTEEPVELLDEILSLAVGIVLHQNDAMVVRLEDLGKLPTDQQGSRVRGRSFHGIPHPRTEEKDDGHGLSGEASQLRHGGRAEFGLAPDRAHAERLERFQKRRAARAKLVFDEQPSPL
jgi:hypothetical protein